MEVDLQVTELQCHEELVDCGEGGGAPAQDQPVKVVDEEAGAGTS